MNSQENHPSKQTLVDFARGKLEPDSIDKVAQHIENCATCVDFLEQSVQDTMIDQLRQAHQSDPDSSSNSESFEFNQTVHFESTSPVVSIEELFVDHPKYQLLGQIGAGGMGAVFRAQHRLMDRDVAIKVIRPEIVSNREAVARFHNEVRAAAKLAHRNIVAAYDAEQVGSAHILIMEFVVGESLSETIKRKGKLPVTHACNYALQIAQGLKHAHEQGMIHRDIKPQNLMKTPKGIIKILDFGLARIGELNDDEGQLTSTGVMMGTADYIAPEQARNARDADIRSDLYSLGCTFYSMLAGEAPFKKARTRVDKVLAHCSESFPSIQDIRSDVPDQVAQMIYKLVAKDPAERYQNPQELIDDLLPFAKPKSSPSTADPSATMANVSAVDERPLYQPVGQPQQVSLEEGSPDAAQAEIPPSSDQLVEYQDSLAYPVEIKTQEPLPHASPQFVTPAKAGPHLARRPLWPLGLGIGGGVLLILFLLFQFGAFGNGNGNQEKQKKNNANGNTVTSPGTEPQTVAALFVYDQFCFGDYGPLRDRLIANGIQVIPVADSKREFTYIDFAEDTTPNKENIRVETTYIELERLISEGQVDAIVFIGGGQLINGADNDSNTLGQRIRSLGNQLNQQGGWICAIGKGLNVPYSLGLLDQSTVVDVGQWLQATPRAGIETSNESVYTDVGKRVITGAEWRNSADLADAIISSIRP